jgi:large subunit ribosomal protein L23
MEDIMNNQKLLLNLIKYPLLTEKTLNLNNKNQYTFIVNRTLKKPQIKDLLETYFNISILKINTIHLPQKTKKIGSIRGNKPKYKKVYITLKKDNIIKELSF